MATKVNLSVHQLERLQKKYEVSDAFELVNNKTMMRMLHISKSTLYRLRKEMNIPYFQIGRQIFYEWKRVIRQLLQQHGALPPKRS
ncbi:helix-turn-helix domain-containing protein [Niabella hirudinis]|uniref:helix-turn-helix domain-containing protein n=1 Tax=Niabella hirudinis TaxID=1285929 RepID=UPI003EBEA271